jgi:hypothetical protein
MKTKTNVKAGEVRDSHDRYATDAWKGARS